MADDLSQYLRDLIVRLERQERHTHVNLAARSTITVIHEAPVPEPEPEPEPGCIPDVMGSSSWIANSDRGDMTYVPAGGYYSPVNAQDGMMIWPEGFAGPQSVEVTISNFGLPAWSSVLTSDFVHVECRRGMTANDFIDNDCLRLSIYKFEGATIGSEPFNYTWWIEYDSIGYTFDPDPPPGQSYLPWPFGSGPVTARLESQPDGAYSAWINDTLLVSDVVPGQPLGPTRLGFAAETNYGPPPDSGETYEPGVPHISAICLNGPATAPALAIAPALSAERPRGGRRPQRVGS